MVAFTHRAADHPAATARIRIHATRREAQGHAALGDHDSCRRALERSQSYRAEQSRDTGTPLWGPRIENGTARLIEASCLVDLRSYNQAADIFAIELTQPPATHADPNSRSRFALRHATAQAGVGDLGGACDTLSQALPTIKTVDSATIRTELRRFFNEADRQRPAGVHRHALDVLKATARGTVDK